MLNVLVLDFLSVLDAHDYAHLALEYDVLWYE